MRKLIKFNNNEILAHYQTNKASINRSCHCLEHKNLLDDKLYAQHVHTLVNHELNRIDALKDNYPTLIRYLNESFRPDLDGALDDTEDLFTEKGYLKITRNVS